MMRDVLPNECRHEIVGVVVASLHSEGHWDLRIGRSLNESQGLELIHIALQKSVVGALITQDVEVLSFVCLDKLQSIILLPCCFVWAQIISKCFDSPRNVHGIADGCKSRNRRI